MESFVSFTFLQVGLNPFTRWNNSSGTSKKNEVKAVIFDVSHFDDDNIEKDLMLTSFSV